VGEVRRLDRCYRCRKVFVADGGERYCPDCRREMRRERNRRRLRVQGMGRSAWTPLLALAALTLAGSPFGHWGPWIGAAAAIGLVWGLGDRFAR
jgi:hypothetical protein